MRISPRVTTALIATCPAAYGAFLLGLALPLDRTDAALTACLLGLLAFVAMLGWACGAYRFLRLLAATLLPTGVATILLCLPS